MRDITPPTPESPDLEKARLLVWERLVMDHQWHEYALEDEMGVERRVHEIGRELLDILGLPVGVLMFELVVPSTGDEPCEP